MFDPPALWRNGPLRLYHGTLRGSVAPIQRRIDPARFKPSRDFGRGFYLTSSLRQASQWADALAERHGGIEPPSILSFMVDRDALARLDVLTFVRGDYDAEDFWSFVQHCRENDDDHGRGANGGWYDVVVGPVAAFWKQRACYAGADQISFHTASALAVLEQASQEVVS